MHQLGQQLAQATACADYANYVATVAELEAMEAEHFYDLTWARVRLEKTGTNPEKDSKAMMDNRVQDAKRQHFQKHAFARLSFTMSKNYERDLNTISREITRRSQEWDRNRTT